MSGQIVVFSSLLKVGAGKADNNPAVVYLASLGKGSLPAQKSALKLVAELFGVDLFSLDWAALRYQHVQWLRSALAERYSPSTSNRMIAAIKGVCRQSYLLELMDLGDYTRIKEVKGIKFDRDEVLAGRFIEISEIGALMQACAADRSLAGRRDAAIIALGYGLGLRRSEICKMDLADYDAAGSTISIMDGKGGKSRVIPVGNGALDALDAWISARGDRPGRVFLGINRGGNIQSEKIPVRCIHDLFIKRCKAAGISQATFHDLRRSFITLLLDSNVDLSMVSKIAGHSDPKTTKRYDRRSLDQRRKAITSVHVPFYGS